MESEKAKNLAERIALLLQESEKPQNDFSFLQSSLEKINERLDNIETQIAFQNSNPQFALAHHKSPHPSLEKFAVAEAVTPEILEHYEKEKACAFEPNGKPCDHCAMCSARGF